MSDEVLLAMLVLLFGLLFIHWALSACKEGMTSSSASSASLSTTTPDETQQTQQPSSYEPYDLSSSNPNAGFVLSQQNAGNINYLKERVDALAAMDGRMSTMEQNMQEMQTQLNALVQQQAEYAQDIAGGSTPPTITGTET